MSVIVTGKARETWESEHKRRPAAARSPAFFPLAVPGSVPDFDHAVQFRAEWLLVVFSGVF